MAWLFGLPAEAVRQGELVFAGLLPVTAALTLLLLASVVIAATALFGRSASRLGFPARVTVAILQCCFVAGVLALLAGPALVVPTLRPGQNAVAVLLDTSRSMGLPAAVGSGQSRLDVAVETLQTSLEPGFADLARVAVFGFDVSLKAGPAGDADGRETRLLESVAAVPAAFPGEALAAVVVLTDGADTTAAIGDMDSPVPVHVIAIGPDSLPGDVRLGRVTMPTAVTAESLVTARVGLHHAAPGTEARIEIREGDRLLAVRPVALTADRPSVTSEVSFAAGPAGIHDLTIRVVADDPLPQNNQARRLLTVQDRRHRVLYIEGEPRWEYKYLRRALARDDVLELVSWLRTTENKTYRQGTGNTGDLAGGVPADPDTLFDFDVVILGSIAATHFDQQQHAWLEAFVAERGGSLLALAGRESFADGGWDVQPLARALPVVLDRDSGSGYSALRNTAGQTAPTVVPTTTGRRAPLIRFLEAEGADVWESLPPLADQHAVAGLKPAATVLLELAGVQGSRPLLVTQPYGMGTSAVLATATTWRWQMRTPPEDRRHELFWRHLVRQLAEAARPRRSLDIRQLEPGRLAVRAALPPGVDGSGARAVLRSEAGSDHAVALQPGAGAGVLEGVLEVTTDGVHHVDVVTADNQVRLTRFVRTGGTDAELANPTRDDDLLRRLAAATGGRYWTPQNADELAAAIRYGAGGVRSDDTVPLWYSPLFFIGLMLIKAAEWLVRRRGGRI